MIVLKEHTPLSIQEVINYIKSSQSKFINDYYDEKTISLGKDFHSLFMVLVSLIRNLKE